MDLNNEFLKVENMKRNQYKACGLMNDKRLFPFVVDMVGNIGPAGLEFLKKISVINLIGWTKALL